MCTLHRTLARRSGAAAWYHELPPLTKGLLTVYLVTGLGAWARVMPLKYIYHDWGLVFKRVPEVRGGCRAMRRAGGRQAGQQRMLSSMSPHTLVPRSS